eukprot:UN23408
MSQADSKKIRAIPCVAEKISPKRLGGRVNTIPPRQLNPEKHCLVTRCAKNLFRGQMVPNISQMIGCL